MVRYALEKNWNFASTAISLHFLAIAALPFHFKCIYLFYFEASDIFAQWSWKGPWRRVYKQESQDGNAVSHFLHSSFLGGRARYLIRATAQLRDRSCRENSLCPSEPHFPPGRSEESGLLSYSAVKWTYLIIVTASSVLGGVNGESTGLWAPPGEEKMNA